MDEPYTARRVHISNPITERDSNLDYSIRYGVIMQRFAKLILLLKVLEQLLAHYNRIKNKDDRDS